MIIFMTIWRKNLIRDKFILHFHWYFKVFNCTIVNAILINESRFKNSGLNSVKDQGEPIRLRIQCEISMRQGQIDPG